MVKEYTTHDLRFTAIYSNQTRPYKAHMSQNVQLDKAHMSQNHWNEVSPSAAFEPLLERIRAKLSSSKG